VQEQPDPPASLLANGRTLRRGIGPRKNKAKVLARWANCHPAFGPLGDIFGQGKTKAIAKKGNGGVIVRHKQG
jgi:hypothetical protein